MIRARGLQVLGAGVLAGFSGLRVGEISGRLWSDLDLTRGFGIVSRTVEEDEAGTLLGTWVYEECGVKQAQEWLGHSDPAATLRHYVRLTMAARAKAVAGLDEVTRAALEAAEEKVFENAQPALDNVVSLASRRQSFRWPSIARSGCRFGQACRRFASASAACWQRLYRSQRERTAAS